MKRGSQVIRRLFATNLRREREAQGISQEALADLAGLHRTYVGSVERGERNISIDNIERLGRALGVEPADLLRKAGLICRANW
jgi:transcriptional regulator with XRE-family HTH domain